MEARHEAAQLFTEVFLEYVARDPPVNVTIALARCDRLILEGNRRITSEQRLLNTLEFARTRLRGVAQSIAEGPGL